MTDGPAKVIRSVLARRSCALVVLPLLAVLAPLDAQQFGASLAVAGDQVLVGEGGNETLPGIVYVFGDSDGSWTEVVQLTGSQSGERPDGFGRALAELGGTLLVGAPRSGATGGSVHVLVRGPEGRYVETARLSASDGAEGDEFGAVVVLGDDIALVSAPAQDEGTGAVYVFRRDANGAWSERAKLRGSDLQPGRRFGTSVALDRDAVLVGAPGEAHENGSVYAFSFDPTFREWVEEGRFETQALGEAAGVGAAVALQDGVALVGAPGAAQGTGAVLVFGRDPQAGGFAGQTILGPFEARPNARFGTAVAFDGSSAWVGAPGDGSGEGTFYVFERDSTGGWTGASKLRAHGVEGRASFGSSVSVQGTLAVAGATGVDSGEGAAVIFVRGADGAWEERSTVVNEMKGYAALTGEEVPCADDRAGAFGCSNVDVVSFLPIKDIGGSRGSRVNDIWGWTDPDTGSEYVLVGRTEGTSFVDITDPVRPVFLGDLPMTEGTNSSIWRDIKVYRDHAYIVADAAGPHGVQVFDLRQLRDVGLTPVVFEETAHYDGIFSAHNIVINEETGFAYAVGSSGGGETCGGGLHMIDIREPASPVFAGCFAHAETGRRNTGYTHDAQCVVYRGPDTEHVGKEICLGANETALSIADVTDKQSPMALAVTSYPNVAYTHQGWLSEDQRYFYLNDEGDEPQGLVPGTRTLVWDVTDLEDPILVKEYIAQTTTTDHNLYVRGDMMYQSNYESGLRILDISDPESPLEVGYFDTTPYGGGGSWSNYPYFGSGLIVLTSMSEGLFVVRSRGRSVLQ